MSSSGAADEERSRSFIEVARRAQIVENAIETIAELGYARASLAQIAQRTGISKGVISYHFASKEDMIQQVVETVGAAFAAFMTPRIDAQTTAKAKLRAYIESNLAFMDAHRSYMLALVEIFPNYRDEDGRLRFYSSVESMLRPVESILRAGQKAGEFRKFSILTMAITIRNAIDAVPQLLSMNPDFEVEAHSRELVELFDAATRKQD